MSERGPIYSAELPSTLPLPSGCMLQAMPGRDELDRVLIVSERTVAAYEVLVWHWRRQMDAAFVARRYAQIALVNAEDIASGRAEELRVEIEEWLEDKPEANDDDTI